MELVEVCDESYPDENILKPIDVEGIALMIIKADGKYFVTSRICTHKTYDLTKGIYAEGYVTCTLHTSTFDLESGDAMNPPATEPLAVYETTVKDGKIYIDIDV